jgi:hypothetical protein
MPLPTGAATPAPDAREVLAAATSECRTIATATVEVGASGSVNGRRVRGRLLVGLASPASVRLEAMGPAGPVFIFVARGTSTTLLLTQENRLLRHDRPAEVLEALTGIPLDAADLRILLTGCGVTDVAAGATQIGNDWRVVPDGSRVLYLHRDSGSEPWRLVAAVYSQPGRPEWRAEYRNFRDNLPHAIHVVSSEGRRFDLSLTLSGIERGVELGPEAFEIVVPAAATPIDLEELQDSGPLAGSTNSNAR